MIETNPLAARQHLRHEVLVGGVSNALFNGLIAWWLIGNGPPLAWGGEHSFAVDIVATALLLPLIVALIVIPLQRGQLRKGRLQAIDLGPGSPVQVFANRLPWATVHSAGVFGLIGLCLIAPLTLLGFFLAGIEQIAPFHYAVFKGAWAGVTAAVLVVPMVLVALRKPEDGQ